MPRTCWKKRHTFPCGMQCAHASLWDEYLSCSSTCKCRSFPFSSHRMLDYNNVFVGSLFVCFVTFIISSSSFVNIIGYYGIALNITNLSGNIYVNFTISFALETLAYAVCLYAFQHLGRKTIYIICIVGGGACCTLSIVPVLLSAPCEYALLTSEKDNERSRKGI